MASTYTDILRLVIPTTGELSGTWGDVFSAGCTQLIETAVAGTAAVTHDNTANYSLTTASGSADESRAMALNVTGTLTAARNVVCPTKSKLYVIKNGTTGGYAITLKTTAGTGISVPSGKYMLLYCDGTNVVDALNHISTITLATPLAATSGGTGLSALGANIATALGIDVGTAGAPLVNGGVLGTPSSGTATNLTGLPIAGLTASTSTAIGVGSIELGHATDTSITRVSAGVAAIEGSNILVSAGPLGTPASGNLANCTFPVTTAQNTYTATCTGITNIATATAYLTPWSRVGDRVSCEFRLSTQTNTYPAAAAVDFDLPVASTFANNYQGSGIGVGMTSAGTYVTGIIRSSGTKMRLSWTQPADGDTGDWRVHMSYQVI